MSYRAILDVNALEDIRRMPRHLARCTLAQLLNLQESPTALSVPSHFPFRRNVQIFKFDYRFADRFFVVNVLFRYAADEQTLHIIDAPWQEALEWWE